LGHNFGKFSVIVVLWQEDWRGKLLPFRLPAECLACLDFTSLRGPKVFRRLILSLASLLILFAVTAPVARGQGTEQVVYNNLTTLSGLGPNYLFDETNRFSTLVGSNTVTAAVADDLIFRGGPPGNPPLLPQPLRITKIAFYVTNNNATAVTVRPLLRLWNDDSFGFPPPDGGAIDHPGTLLRAINLGPVTLAAAPSGGFSSTLVTVDLTGGNPFGGLNIPGSLDANGKPIAGDPYRIWAGLAFDNNGGRTGATLNQMDGIGQLINDISQNGLPIRGRSGDVAWSSSPRAAPGPELWARDLPAGAFFNYIGDPNSAHPGNDGIPGTDDDPFTNFAWQVWARPGYFLPEPGTAGLFGCAGLPFAFLVWRRRRG
jgi:hypothetical protein